MAWCPKCEEEYEDDVVMCAACKVELVSSLEDISRERILVVLNTEEEVDKVLEFLSYSGITSAKQQQTTSENGEEAFVVTVEEEEWASAQRFMQGYALVEKQDPNMEDFYFDKYKTVDLENASQLAEIKSSYLSFLGLGAIILVVGVMNLLHLTSFLAGNLALVFTVMGVAFILIGIYTKASVAKKVNHTDSVQEAFQTVYTWYVTEFPIDGFFQRHSIDDSDMDEGVRYFTLMDLIIEECKTTTIETTEEMINTVAEKVYAQL